LHVHADTGKVSEEHTSFERTGLIVHDIDREPDAWALVVISISLVKLNQVSLVQLVLELSSEVNHQSIFRSSLDGSSVSGGTVREIQGLHGGWVLDELMHETQVVITTLKNVLIDLLSDRRVVKPISIHGE
jgi:hypothetical protein